MHSAADEDSGWKYRTNNFRASRHPTSRCRVVRASAEVDISARESFNELGPLFNFWHHPIFLPHDRVFVLDSTAVN